jgi:hypothetical protein
MLCVFCGMQQGDGAGEQSPPCMDCGAQKVFILFVSRYSSSFSVMFSLEPVSSTHRSHSSFWNPHSRALTGVDEQEREQEEQGLCALHFVAVKRWCKAGAGEAK